MLKPSTGSPWVGDQTQTASEKVFFPKATNASQQKFIIACIIANIIITP